MTRAEASRYILSQWMNGEDSFNAQAVMMTCIVKGFPARRKDICDLIRLYVDRQTENRKYGRKVK